MTYLKQVAVLLISVMMGFTAVESSKEFLLKIGPAGSTAPKEIFFCTPFAEHHWSHREIRAYTPSNLSTAIGIGVGKREGVNDNENIINYEIAKLRREKTLALLQNFPGSIPPAWLLDQPNAGNYPAPLVANDEENNRRLISPNTPLHMDPERRVMF